MAGSLAVVEDSVAVEDSAAATAAFGGGGFGGGGGDHSAGFGEDARMPALYLVWGWR